MSEHVGFLVVSDDTGYLLEGRDHAAKIFESKMEALQQCSAMSKRVPVRLFYEEMVRSLLKGSTFCFSTESAHAKFLRRLRNDPGNKAFVELSRDRNFITWRIKSDAKAVADDPGMAVRQTPDPVHASGPSVATGEPAGTFNPEILVRPGN